MSSKLACSPSNVPSQSPTVGAKAWRPRGVRVVPAFAGALPIAAVTEIAPPATSAHTAVPAPRAAVRRSWLETRIRRITWRKILRGAGDERVARRLQRTVDPVVVDVEMRHRAQPSRPDRRDAHAAPGQRV